MNLSASFVRRPIGTVLLTVGVALRQASDAADQTEQQILNRYRAGQVGYTTSSRRRRRRSRRSLVQNAVSRQTSAVALIQALGGG